MKPYNELTDRGKYRRLLRLARQVLQAYDLPLRQVSFYIHESTTMFKVIAESGEKFVLRFYSDADSSLAENRTEMFWLSRLKRDTDLRIVEPVPRRDGELITIANMEGVPPDRRCALYRWIPGRPLDEQLSADYYHQLGGMMARLHTHAESLVLPADLQPKRWDRVFYYPDEKAIYRQPEYRALFPESRAALLDRAVSFCDALLGGLYREKPPILIHGDLQYYNVHVFRRQLYLLDFEDVLLGYPVQDVAVTLYYGTQRPDYADLCAAYREGYSALRPWPVESDLQLTGLMAARLTNFINYVAEYDPNPQDFLDGMFERLESLMAQLAG